jgi:hypothetical protein
MRTVERILWRSSVLAALVLSFTACENPFVPDIDGMYDLVTFNGRPATEVMRGWIRLGSGKTFRYELHPQFIGGESVWVEGDYSSNDGALVFTTRSSNVETGTRASWGARIIGNAILTNLRGVAPADAALARYVFQRP